MPLSTPTFLATSLLLPSQPQVLDTQLETSSPSTKPLALVLVLSELHPSLKPCNRDTYKQTKCNQQEPFRGLFFMEA
jgi:hypothetical protein